MNKKDVLQINDAISWIGVMDHELVSFVAVFAFVIGLFNFARELFMMKKK